MKRKVMKWVMLSTFVLMAGMCFFACRNAEKSTGAAEGDSIRLEDEVDDCLHAKYIYDEEELSLNQSIDAVKKELEDRGFVLGEKDPSHKKMIFYDQFNALWVYYDSETNKVWMIIEMDLHYEDMDLGEFGEKRLYDIIIPEYEEKYKTKCKGFCEGVDCIEIPGGCIVFAYDDELGALIMTIDEKSSNNFENLYDTTYGVTPYGIEDR